MVVNRFLTQYINVYYPDDNAVLTDVHISQYWDSLSTTVASVRANTASVNGGGGGLGELKGKEDLIEKLSFFIWHVTGFHNHVGNVADYLMSANFGGAKIRAGRSESDVQVRVYKRPAPVCSLRPNALSLFPPAPLARALSFPSLSLLLLLLPPSHLHNLSFSLPL